MLTGKPKRKDVGNPVPSFIKNKEGVTTILKRSTTEDELLLEVRKSSKIPTLLGQNGRIYIKQISYKNERS